VAFVDLDGDDNKDLIAGNFGEPNRIYHNDSGLLRPTAVWSSAESDHTTTVAWGDLDGDGDPDLVTGNLENPDVYHHPEGEPNRAYENTGATLDPTAVWTSTAADTAFVPGRDITYGLLVVNEGGTTSSGIVRLTMPAWTDFASMWYEEYTYCIVSPSLVAGPCWELAQAGPDEVVIVRTSSYPPWEPYYFWLFYVTLQVDSDAPVCGSSDAVAMVEIGDYESDYSNNRDVVAALVTTAPELSTAPAIQTGLTSARSGGYISCGGNRPVASRGVCWSSYPMPTLADHHTTDGTGDGPFVSFISGLSPDTDYFVRAWAANSEGTSYGPEVVLSMATTPVVVFADGYESGDTIMWSSSSH
jgi:hypothetical protein